MFQEPKFLKNKLVLKNMVTLLDSKSTENHRDHYRWYDEISGRSAASLGSEPYGWQDVDAGLGGQKWRTKRNSRGIYTTYDYTEYHRQHGPGLCVQGPRTTLEKRLRDFDTISSFIF